MEQRHFRLDIVRLAVLPLLVLVVAAGLAAWAVWSPHGGSPTAQASSSLTIEKACSNIYGVPEAAVGDWVIYDYAIANGSGETLNRVSVIDDVEGDLTGSFPETLDDGDSATVQEFHRVTESDLRPLVNEVTAIYETDEGTPVSASATCTMDILHLTVTKTVEVAGGVSTFTFTVINDGSVDLTRGSVVDTFLGGIRNQFPENLASGEEATVVITRPRLDTDPLCNKVTVEYRRVQPGSITSVKAQAEACVEEKRPPDIETKSSETGTVPPGTSVTDTATLSGDPMPTGKVKFFLCQPGEVTAGGCEKGGTQVGPEKTLVGGSATSDPTTDSTAAGKYCWRVEYSGDDIYTEASHTNTTSECFTVRVTEEPGKLTIEKHKRYKKWCRGVREYPWPAGPSYFYPDVRFRVCGGEVSDAECGDDITLWITGPDPVSVQLPAGTYTVCEDPPKAPFSSKLDVVEGGPCKTVEILPGEESKLLFVNCHPKQAYLCPQDD